MNIVRIAVLICDLDYKNNLIRIKIARAILHI